MTKPKYDDFVFSDNTETVYWVREDQWSPLSLWEYYSRGDLETILKKLPFEIDTFPTNVSLNDRDCTDPLLHLVEVCPSPSIIMIRPPKGRRILQVHWKGGTQDDNSLSLVDILKPDNLMTDLGEEGFRCCFHPEYTSFLKKPPQGNRVDGYQPKDFEISIYKYNRSDVIKINKFIETLTPEKDEVYFDLKRAEVELEAIRNILKKHKPKKST